MRSHFWVMEFTFQVLALQLNWENTEKLRHRVSKWSILALYQWGMVQILLKWNFQSIVSGRITNHDSMGYRLKDTTYLQVRYTRMYSVDSAEIWHSEKKQDWISSSRTKSVSSSLYHLWAKPWHPWWWGHWEAKTGVSVRSELWGLGDGTCVRRQNGR